MDDLSLEQGAPGDRAALRHHRDVLDVIQELGGEAVDVGAIEHAVLVAGDGGLVGLAQAGGRLDQRLQHRLQVERRPADDPEHVGGGGLLLQRNSRQLIEQACIFNSDRGLVGKGPDQGDLLLREGLHLATPYADDADQMFLAQQWDSQYRAGVLVLEDDRRKPRIHQ